MNILFTICGRAGSKGVRNKNFKDFLGYPLVYYTVSAIDLYLKKTPSVKGYIALNTDSEELISLFQENIKLDIDIVRRHSSLGLDDTPKIDVIFSTLTAMTKRKNTDYEMVVDLDITSPLRTVKDVSNLVNKKIASDVDVIYSITDSRRNPYFNMVKKSDHGYERVIASSFNTRQEAPEVFDMNASLYAYSPQFLENGKGLFEGESDIIKMKDTAVWDLDHIGDFELMQVIAEYLFGKGQQFKEIRENIHSFLQNY